MTPLLGIFLIFIVIPVVFYDTSYDMVKVWSVNETFTHGFLIFPISLWLIWQKRDLLLTQPLFPEARVFVLLALVLFTWFVAYIVEVQVVQQLMMILMIPVIVWIVMGRVILKKVLFPLGYLLFAVPLGQSLIPVMMDFTANFSVTLIQLTGIPIYQDGLYFSLPSGSWSVVEECSGVRYLIASIALGSLYAHLNYTSTIKRIIFISFATLLPILANGIRAYGIVMIGHLSGMKLATGVDHLLYGWVFFGIVIFFMFYIGSFWWDTVDTKSENSTTHSNSTGSLGSKNIAISLLGILMLLVGTKLIANQAILPTYTDALNSKLSINLQNHFNGWQHDESLSTGWRPIISNPDLYIEKSYRYGLDLIQLNIAFFRFQRQEAEAVSSYNRVTDPLNGDWKLIYASDFQDKDIYVTENEIRRGDQKLLVWKWYRIGNKLTPNPYIAKIFDAYNLIILGRRDATMITVATQFDVNKDVTRERLRNFNHEALASIYLELDKLVQ